MNDGTDLRALANSIIDSYEMRVSAVDALMNQAYQILKSFRLEIEDMIAKLRDNLARAESLRKKDFDRMMNGVIGQRRRTESEAEKNLIDFRLEEEEMISRLRKIILGGSRSSLEDIEIIREDILKRQKERERKIIKSLKRFHIEQEELRIALKKLLSKGEELRIKDLRRMLRSLNAQQSDRDAELTGIVEDFEVIREQVQNQWQSVSRASN